MHSSFSVDREILSSPSKISIIPRNPAILISGPSSSGRNQSKEGKVTSFQSFLNYTDDGTSFLLIYLCKKNYG